MPKSIVTSPSFDEKLAPPVGPFSYAVLGEGEKQLHIAGQIGADKTGKVVSSDFVEQYRQTLENIKTIVEGAGGTLDDVCSLIHYTTISLRATDEAFIGMKQARTDFFKRDFPTSTLVQVVGLLDPEALIEVDARAVLR